MDFPRELVLLPWLRLKVKHTKIFAYVIPDLSNDSQGTILAFKETTLEGSSFALLFSDVWGVAGSGKISGIRLGCVAFGPKP